MRPLVSVILPVYNENPLFLRAAVSSILEQQFTDFELILLDDGSDRHETLEEMGRLDKSDPRIRLLKGKRVGLTRMLNKGLAESKGELICRQDSDDWSDPERIATQVRFMEQEPPLAVVGTNVTLHQEDGNVLWESTLPERPEDVLKAFPDMNPFCHGATCFRKGAAHAVEGYRERFSCSQDYDFFWRICERFGGANLRPAFYHRRFTENSVSTRRCLDQATVAMSTRILGQMRKTGAKEDVDEAIRRAQFLTSKKRYRNWARLKQGDLLLLAGRYHGALFSYLRGLASDPGWHVGYLKLVRWVAFLAHPPGRARLFKAGKSIEI